MCAWRFSTCCTTAWAIPSTARVRCCGGWWPRASWDEKPGRDSTLTAGPYDAEQAPGPSPVGHPLAGNAAGWLVAGRPPLRPHLDAAGTAAALVRNASPYALLGAAPDLDLLVGLHSRYTHSIGAAVLTG